MVKLVSVENLLKKERYIFATTADVVSLCTLDVKEFELDTLV